MSAAAPPRSATRIEHRGGGKGPGLTSTRDGNDLEICFVRRRDFVDGFAAAQLKGAPRGCRLDHEERAVLVRIDHTRVVEACAKNPHEEVKVWGGPCIARGTVTCSATTAAAKARTGRTASNNMAWRWRRRGKDEEGGECVLGEESDTEGKKE